MPTIQKPPMARRLPETEGVAVIPKEERPAAHASPPQRGGDLGFFARNEKIAAFNAAFSLVVGTLSQPVQSPYGVHLLKVVEKEPSKKLALTEARDEIIKALKRAKEVKVYKEWVTKLLKDGEIYKNEAVFDTFS